MDHALNWTFTLPGPLGKIKDTIATLSALQKSIAQQNKGLMLSFNIQGTQVSAQQRQAQTCPTADLLAGAKAQAQKVAGAAGLSVGSVLAMSSGAAVPISAERISLAVFLVGSAAPTNCSMTVKFALLRY